MSASVPYADVVRMLENCAKGFEIRRTTHGRKVDFGSKSYRNLPKHESIFIFEVRKMVRHLGIDKDCAQSFGCF